MLHWFYLGLYRAFCLIELHRFHSGLGRGLWESYPDRPGQQIPWHASKGSRREHVHICPCHFHTSQSTVLTEGRNLTLIVEKLLFTCLFQLILLTSIWFIMLCYFLLYSKVIQFCIYVYILYTCIYILSTYSFPLWLITAYWIKFPTLYYFSLTFERVLVIILEYWNA